MKSKIYFVVLMKIFIVLLLDVFKKVLYVFIILDKLNLWVINFCIGSFFVEIVLISIGSVFVFINLVVIVMFLIYKFWILKLIFLLWILIIEIFLLVLIIFWYVFYDEGILIVLIVMLMLFWLIIFCNLVNNDLLGIKVWVVFNFLVIFKWFLLKLIIIKCVGEYNWVVNNVFILIGLVLIIVIDLLGVIVLYCMLILWFVGSVLDNIIVILLEIDLGYLYKLLLVNGIFIYLVCVLLII